jgi:hypothetical protein
MLADEHKAQRMSTCRYYKDKYPEVDDVVMVTVNQIAEMGAYVSLVEYGGAEGMVSLLHVIRILLFCLAGVLQNCTK